MTHSLYDPQIISSSSRQTYIRAGRLHQNHQLQSNPGNKCKLECLARLHVSAIKDKPCRFTAGNVVGELTRQHRIKLQLAGLVKMPT